MNYPHAFAILAGLWFLSILIAWGAGYRNAVRIYRDRTVETIESATRSVKQCKEAVKTYERQTKAYERN